MSYSETFYRLLTEEVAWSKTTGQNRKECTLRVVWAPETEKRRNVKFNFEIILPLIFLQYLQKTEISENKKEQWEHCVSQITICILFTSMMRQVMNILGE